MTEFSFLGELLRTDRIFSIHCCFSLIIKLVPYFTELLITIIIIILYPWHPPCQRVCKHCLF